MKTIAKGELFKHLSGFLQTKGIELKEGSYARGVEKSCGLLTNAINLGQKGLAKAKGGIDRNLEKMREVIHEKTAPKSPAAPPAKAPAAPGQRNPPGAAASARKAVRKKTQRKRG